MEFLTMEQVKKLSVDEASAYCNTLRAHLVDTVKASGGHLSSNLGVAEISMACVRVFNLPQDRVIYDVGHQSYIHKLLTGRILSSENLRVYGGYSGFTKREESDCDPFGAGHSSTALSAAVGFAKASRIKGDNNTTVAVIGDGAFCTGMTFEALNNIDPEDKIVIILNDNEMSISKNVGAMSEYLLKIRSTKKYLRFKKRTKKAFLKIPLIGGALSRFAGAVKDFVKSFVVNNTFFEELGIEYIGPADGNDLETVEKLLSDAKNIEGPILVHLCTKKGKGFADAEKDPDRFHALAPLSEKRGEGITFSNAFGEYVLKEAERDLSVTAVTAAMCDGTGLKAYREKFPERFFDVGICEEHAVTFCAAMNAGGMSPYFAVYSTFFQRCYDQLLHDVALQNLKITFAIDRAGFSANDGPTHHGLFDVPMFLSAPGVALYSPATLDEMLYSFDEAKKSNGAVAVRYPKGTESKRASVSFDAHSDFSVYGKKADVLFVTYGRIVEEVLGAVDILSKNGISATVLKFLRLDTFDKSDILSKIDEVSAQYIFVVEEGIQQGGFCEHFYSVIKPSIPCEFIAINNTFIPHGSLEALYEHSGLSANKISEKVISCVNRI